MALESLVVLLVLAMVWHASAQSQVLTAAQHRALMTIYDDLRCDRCTRFNATDSCRHVDCSNGQVSSL